MKKLTIEDFIKKSKKLHGDKYDYSKSVYINGKTKICITCIHHGDFWIRPNDFLNGTGCPFCGGTKKMTTYDFIIKANKVHNNFFSYEKTNYNGSNNKVIVTCPIHGDFEVKANNHLNGANCKMCQTEKKYHKITLLDKVNKSTKHLTQDDFLKKCYNVWGDKYTYEKVLYKLSKEKVTITCPIHGDFEITPNHFLAGRGCPICSKNKKLTTNDFIKKAKLIHSNKYSYKNTNYISTHKLVEIECTEHGTFFQTPANHLKGEGCPYCKQSKLENTIELFLQTNNISFEKQKTFNWLIDKRNLYLDFYLPDYNVTIECQGEQHFNDVEIFNSKVSNVMKRDSLKKMLCEKNGINVLYYSELKIDFPYEVITDKEKLLEKILENKK